MPAERDLLGELAFEKSQGYKPPTRPSGSCRDSQNQRGVKSTKKEAGRDHVLVFVLCI